MQTSMLLGLFDWIGDFFKALFDLIPKTIYLFYASLVSLVDVFQLAFRKLAGLDVYYDSQGRAVTGDIVTNFIAGLLGIDINPSQGAHFDYSPLTTVFWSFVLFGVIICIMATFVAVIKSHYSYDEKAAKGPMQYVYTALKSVVNIFAVPVIIVLALYVSQALLTALDSITSVTSGSIQAMFGEQTSLLQPVNTSRNVSNDTGQLVNDKDVTYIYYDIFGASCYIHYGTETDPNDWPGWPSGGGSDLALVGATTQTFSGSIFKMAAYNANRARTGHIKRGDTTISGLRSGELFSMAETDDELANMIDTAFACNLHLKDSVTLDYNGTAKMSSGGWVNRSHFTNYLSMNIVAFSKFDVGAVWYYYDLWSFNFMIGFGAILVCIVIFINIIFGMMVRLITCVGLFLIAPPFFGLAPLDGGEAAKKWRDEFVKKALMTYGAVVGMNVFFIILPLFNQIKFFKIDMADSLMQTFIIIAGLITIKSFIGTISSMIGADDANKTGEEVAKEAGKVAGTGAMAVMKTSKGMAKIGIAGIKGANNWRKKHSEFKALGGKAGLASREATEQADKLNEQAKQTAYDTAVADEQKKKEAMEKARENFEMAKGTSGEAAARAAFFSARNTYNTAQATTATAKSDLRTARSNHATSSAALRDATMAHEQLKSARPSLKKARQGALNIFKGGADIVGKTVGGGQFIKDFLDSSAIKKADNPERDTRDYMRKMKDLMDPNAPTNRDPNAGRVGRALIGLSDNLEKMKHTLDEMNRRSRDD